MAKTRCCPRRRPGAEARKDTFTLLSHHRSAAGAAGRVKILSGVGPDGASWKWDDGAARRVSLRVSTGPESLRGPEKREPGSLSLVRRLAGIPDGGEARCLHQGKGEDIVNVLSVRASLM